MWHTMPDKKADAAEVEIPRLVLTELFDIASRAEELAWKPFRTGIDIYRLYGGDAAQPAAALLRYQPGASAPRHIHIGVEHIFILSGSQRDETGVYQAGTFIVNPAGSTHSVISDNGCIVLVLWQQPVQFTG